MAGAETVRGLELLEAQDAPAALRRDARRPRCPCRRARSRWRRMRPRGVGCHYVNFLSVLFFASGCAALIYETGVVPPRPAGGRRLVAFGGACLLCQFHGRHGARQRAAAAAGARLRCIRCASSPRSKPALRASASLIPLALPFVQQAYVRDGGLRLRRRPAASGGLRARADPADHADGRDVAGDLAMAGVDATKAPSIDRVCSTRRTSPAAPSARCSPGSTCCASTTRSSRARLPSPSTSSSALAAWWLAARAAETVRLHPRPDYRRKPPAPPESGFRLAPSIWSRRFPASRRLAPKWCGRASCRCSSAPASTRSR